MVLTPSSRWGGLGTERFSGSLKTASRRVASRGVAALQPGADATSDPRSVGATAGLHGRNSHWEQVALWSRIQQGSQSLRVWFVKPANLPELGKQKYWLNLSWDYWPYFFHELACLNFIVVYAQTPLEKIVCNGIRDDGILRTEHRNQWLTDLSQNTKI